MEECGSLAAPRTHVSNLAALCMLDAGGKGTFQSKPKKESLIRLAVAPRTQIAFS